MDKDSPLKLPSPILPNEENDHEEGKLKVPFGTPKDYAASPKYAPKIFTPGAHGKKIGYVHPHMSSPSPSHKLPGAGSRNELFLRSVLSSPYTHDAHSYTPMSATPAGVSPRPVFKTPVTKDNGSPAVHKTPQGSRPPLGSSSGRKQRVINPFDAALLEQLDGPVFMSPGVFTVQSTPSTDEKKPFRWSIEHIAELHPADIDEMPVYQQITPDKEVEERAQKAIENYFSNNLIAPSPWNSNSKGTGAKNLVQTPLKTLEPDLQGSIQKQLPFVTKIPELQDASAQTMLSLPVNFDVKEVLGEYMVCEDTELHETSQKKEAVQDVLSTSSLRRKLFFHPDNSSFAISPVKTAPVIDEEVDFNGCSSPQVISANEAEIPFQHATPLRPPSRSHFSSSPIKNIKGLETPEFQNKQQQRELFSSPELSPIVRGLVSTKRSSGLFSPHEKIFGEGTVQKNMSVEFAQSLSSPEVSPIKGGLCKTPQTKSRSKLSIQSPGVSPICANPGILDDDQGSFIQEPIPDFPSDESDVETNTPLASDGHSERKPTTTRKISHLARRGQRNILHDFEDTAMEFETNEQPSKHLRFADEIKTSSLLCAKDYSMEMDDHGIAPNSTNHDTGYQTASLQSTNHDTGLASSQSNPFSVTANSEIPPSTNLTSLFSKLPIDSVLQDPNQPTDFPEFIAKENDAKAFNPVSSNKFSLRENPLIEQILDVTNPEQFGHAPYSEEEILERARSVLDMVNRMYPEMQSTSTDPEEDLASMIMNKTGLSLLHELEPIVSSTPQKNGKGDYSNTVAASEQALAILKQAGEDLAKFGHMLSSIKTSMDSSSIPTQPS
ncbi:protein aurora borealis-like [Saccostrea echinata]|uniref:protein aurora borealis-like n=1 Tax=Saccostrea echinata TaxID=191078 RepID=UPI002A7F5B84|nr:protein aurora borealis-like [Saccostrea echinata]